MYRALRSVGALFLDQDHECFWEDAVVRHRRASLIALHSGSEGVEVGDVHDNRNVT
jgi:hypothetical protein